MLLCRVAIRHMGQAHNGSSSVSQEVTACGKWLPCYAYSISAQRFTGGAARWWRCAERCLQPRRLQAFREQFPAWSIWCELRICISHWNQGDGDDGLSTTLGESLMVTLAELFLS